MPVNVWRPRYRDPENAGEESVLEDIELAEKIAYGYIAPILIAMGLFGSLASLITLSHRKFSGRLYTYLKVLYIFTSVGMTRGQGIIGVVVVLHF